MKNIQRFGLAVSVMLLLLVPAGCRPVPMRQAGEKASESVLNQSAESQSSDPVLQYSSPGNAFLPSGPVSQSQNGADLLDQTQSFVQELAETLKELDEVTEEDTSVPNN